MVCDHLCPALPLLNAWIEAGEEISRKTYHIPEIQVLNFKLCHPNAAAVEVKYKLQ